MKSSEQQVRRMREMLNVNDWMIPTSVFVEWVKDLRDLDILPREARAFLDTQENRIRADMGIGLLGTDAAIDPLSEN